MDIKKFNSRMGRPKYSKGGYIKKIGNRHYFDDGGVATNAVAPGVGGGNLTNTNTNGIGGISQALGLNAASANIQQGTNAAQLNNAYTGANNAINAQVGLANAVNPGVQTGVNAQNQVQAQELAMAQGAGPNPAQAQLAQATGQNVNNEAALLAGQRGASSNVGLAGRNIGQQGAATEQQAVGQGATLQAQQEIAAQQNAANIAAQQVNQGQNATSALNQTQQNEQNILQNANTSANNSAVGMQSNINNVNAQANQAVLGGLASGASSVLGAVGLAEGGKVDPHAKHKLEFVHKMAKMGLDHFDEGTPDGPVQSNSWFGPPAAKASTPPPQQTSAPIDPQAAQSVSDSFKNATHKFADGGSISANPLVSGIVNTPSAMPMQSQGFTPSQASSAPNVQEIPLGPSTIGSQMKAGYDQGHANYVKKQQAAQQLAQGQSTFNNDLLDQSSPPVMDSGSDSSMSSDTQNAYTGGEIWKLHPSQHAQYSATHFSNYFSKGGEAKDVPAMVSAGERYLNPDEVKMVQHGADPTKLGYIFPGKAKVKGDSLKNDTIPTTLKEGGVVIDRKNMGHPNKERLFILKSMRATGKHKPEHMKRPGGMK